MKQLLEEICRVHIRKEAYKFSCAHMTVFPDGSKERLHGHNYQVEVHVDLPLRDVDKMVEFRVIKDEVKKLCVAWDEYVLLAARCPFLVLDKTDGESLSFKLCGKHYLIPRDEVILLETDNIIVESLAHIFCKNLLSSLDSGLEFLGIEVRIDETNGQGASYRWQKAIPSN